MFFMLSHTSEDSFIIQPIPNTLDETLIIDRTTNECRLTSNC